VWVGPALLAAVLTAQQKPVDASAPAPKGATAAERLAELQADQKKLTDEFQAKAKEYSAKAKEAQAKNEPLPAAPMRPDFAPLVERAQAAAKDFAGTNDAPQFLVFVVRNSGANRDAASAAMTTLVEKHLDHEVWGQLASSISSLPRLIGKDAAEKAFDSLAKSSNADVRGYVSLARNKKTIDEADRKGEAYATAKADLQKAGEAAKDAQLKKQINDAIELREKYGAGNVAPEIAGEDLDGVAFKLSDYKGKVIFLDFWGDW
jgi:hypothetical protein